MAELQQKYNIRPRDKNYTTDPPKKIFSRGKKSEASQQSTKTKTAKTQNVETSNAKTKTTETKETHTNRP